MCFVGKAFFKPFRKALTEIASLKERFAIKGLNEVGKVIKGSKVLIMGLTYKENVPDTRESPVREMVKELKEFGVNVYSGIFNGEEANEKGFYYRRRDKIEALSVDIERGDFMEDRIYRGL